MIIVKLHGGLGNQLFQYAFGLNLSLKYKRQMFLDVQDLNSNQLRNIEIDNFQIEIQLATKPQLRKFNKSRYARVNYYLNKLLLNGKNYFFEPKVSNRIIADEMCYYWGYWQKPQFVIEIDKEIRKLFVLKSPLSTQAKAYKDKILNLDGESVSMHIRKTDYLLHKNNFLSSCEAQYYFNSIETIRKLRCCNLHFFIFSDDFKWVQDNLNFQGIDYTFVNPTVQNRPSEDLHLMSICNHNIIANSTFSWWAAYLNNYENKITISPKFWFSDHSKKNLNLENWIEIENN
ncbi:alpha-1,2-fucosyltransferase [Dyadobacter sp. 3J3]|uniref:alpha-1,2-fucosyltransferase n=1 Tax=Dyadobacter sp. 3J3 TaxID=2606600 RepID=UPI00135B652F|nr:alpha-1,2-fucosyltransferase [Dyadobacter sp. 3J3]